MGAGINGIIGFVKSFNYKNSHIIKMVSDVKIKETGLTINKDEIGGLRWCRDNLPHNSILLSNKLFSEEGERSFWSSSLSERQMYFESYYFTNVGQYEINKKYSIVKKFYNGDSHSLYYLKSKGVTYAHKFPKEGEILFENSELLIVKL